MVTLRGLRICTGLELIRRGKDIATGIVEPVMSVTQHHWPPELDSIEGNDLAQSPHLKLLRVFLNGETCCLYGRAGIEWARGFAGYE